MFCGLALLERPIRSTKKRATATCLLRARVYDAARDPTSLGRIAVWVGMVDNPPSPALNGSGAQEASK